MFNPFLFPHFTLRTAWSSAGKEKSPWLSAYTYYLCHLVYALFPLVSGAGHGIRLYRFLIIVFRLHFTITGYLDLLNPITNVGKMKNDIFIIS